MSLSGICLALLAAGPGLTGPFVGQGRPPRTPELFAPGIVCTNLATRDVAMAADGSELYFSVFLPGFRGAAVLWTRRRDGAWTPPEVAPFSRDPRWRNLEPCVSPDGGLLLFTSDRPEDPAASAPGTFGLWMAERQGEGWGPPRRLPERVNGKGRAFYASLTRDRTLYFLREEGRGGWIFRSTWGADGFQEATRLPAPFNQDSRQANPWISPDECTLLVPMEGRPDSLGGADYYAYFRRPGGAWTGPVHLPAPVNSEDGDEYSASLSPDGRALFFGSARALPGPRPATFEGLKAYVARPGSGQEAIWWVDAAFLDDLRREALARP